MNVDCISQLPENVIHAILTLLPIKDAAKTAILSSTWRRHWRSIPQLVFDEGFAPPNAKPRARNNKIIMNIYKSLLVHDGPVPKFVLAIPGLTPCDEIDHIIAHLSGRGVQELVLVLSRVHGHTYKLPSSLFTALQLNRLELEGCLFMAPPPWFAGFSKLKSLALTQVNVASDFFERFLPKCPLLKDLKLVNCTGATKLELDAPRLRVFFFEGGHLQKLCFKRTPRLSTLRVSADVSRKLELEALFASLPAIKQFQATCEFLEVLAKGGHVPRRLPTLLHRLQILEVCCLTFDSSEMQRVLVCLIMSSPNLRGLTITSHASNIIDTTNNSVSSIWSSLEAEDRIGSHCCSLQHLRVCHIRDSLGTPFELELVRFVLATAPLLSTIQIKPHRQLSDKCVNRFMKAVLRYKRVSKETEVIFDW